MTTTPDEQPTGEHDADKPGAEIGMTDGEGSTFEPEEDLEGSSGP